MKTKVEREVDHEQERTDWLKAENARKRAEALEKVCNRLFSDHCNSFVPQLCRSWRMFLPQKNADLALARERAEEKAAWSYDRLFDEEDGKEETVKTVKQLEEDFM